MSSQSTARAPRIRTTPRSAPAKSVASTYASSPESLWVHSTPGCARLAAIPELSFTRGLCSAPVRATLGMLCRVRRRRITATKRIALLGPRQGVMFRPMLAALRSRRVEKLPDQVVLRGKGSSREQSPYAEMCAGIKLVVAENIERIYRENCQNLGVLATTDFSIIDKVRRGEAIPLSAFTAGEGEITRGIIEYGGLFNFNVARLQGKVVLSPPATPPRPMTLGEKIIARHR